MSAQITQNCRIIETKEMLAYEIICKICVQVGQSKKRYGSTMLKIREVKKVGVRTGSSVRYSQAPTTDAEVK